MDNTTRRTNFHENKWGKTGWGEKDTYPHL